jgi:hypothetical protein
LYFNRWPKVICAKVEFDPGFLVADDLLLFFEDGVGEGGSKRLVKDAFSFIGLTRWAREIDVNAFARIVNPCAFFER